MHRYIFSLIFVLFSFPIMAEDVYDLAPECPKNEPFKKIEFNEVTKEYERVGDCFSCGIRIHRLKFIDEKLCSLCKNRKLKDGYCISKTIYHHAPGVRKPIIYLYPEKTTNVSIQLGFPHNTTHTYPKYNDGWEIIANPDGTLTDATGRHYYALYWEGKSTHNDVPLTEGFVVKGEDTIKFLEEKLSVLGLTEREANEFIVYWLPKLENEKYNFIRFQTKAEQDKNMPLYVTPTPDTVIRVMMEYTDLDNPIQVKEQILPSTPKRTGFTVVEWGGTELD